MISCTPLAIVLSLSVAQAPAAPATAAPAPAAQPPVQSPAAQPSVVQGLPPAARLLTFDEALNLAVQRNFDLQVVAARLKQAEQGYWKAWSGYLPQVTLGGTYTRNGEAVSLPFPVALNTAGYPGTPPSLVTIDVTVVPQTQLQGTADGTQMLFSPTLWFAIQSASRGTDAARDAAENARRQILFGTAQAYYGVAALREAARIAERLLEISQRQEKDARVRYQAGTIAKVGLLRAEIERAKAEQDLLRSRNAYYAARLALAQLIDSPADFDVVVPDEPKVPADPSKLEEAALRDRADVKAARNALLAAESGRRSLYASYVPNVYAFGHYQNADVAGLTGQELWSVGVGLQWRILDGGLREANLREAGAKVVEAHASLGNAESNARKEVGQSWLDLESARANATKAKEQRELAAENQRLVDVSYRAGSATAVEQADATAQLRTAELTALTEVLNSYVAALRVLQASGSTLR